MYLEGTNNGLSQSSFRVKAKSQNVYLLQSMISICLPSIQSLTTFGINLLYARCEYSVANLIKPLRS